jgi:HEAT repeat protein
VSSSQGAVAFTVLDLLSRSVLEAFGPEKAREFESHTCGAMFPAPRLSQVVQDFARLPPDAETLRLFSLVLTALPDDRFFDGAQEFFWTSSEATEGVLLDYMVRFASGREAAFEPVLARGSPTLAIAALRGLSSLGTDEARGVLIKAFDNPHLEVKVSAIGFLPDAAAETVRSEVTRLLEDPSSEVRLSTLNVLSHLGSTAVGPVLVRRIQNVDLTTLSAQERKLLLDTLVRLSPRRGSEIAIEILDATQMIPTQGPEETRAIAAEVLGSVNSDAVEQALERAARKRWSNSAPVREAAARSLETLRSQRFLQKGTGQ